MLFNSYIFIFLFLPVSILGFNLLNRLKLTVASTVWLVFSSLFFYSWWDIGFLPLILFSILFNFTFGSILGKEVDNPKINQKVVLVLGIIVNLSLLAYFKYLDFMISNANSIFSSQIKQLNLALPLAISFFTFQQVAYLVDSYRGKTREYNFLNYALFVSFFPQLIAGPIVHHGEMMPQFSKVRNKLLNHKNLAAGLFIFILGLFKKVVIADTLSGFVKYGFDSHKTLTFVEAWISSLSYTFQIYFDFSGYTDMAVGCALMFNIILPINFNSPYKSLNIQEFWRRWHITLSRFLRDHIYIPLGGNRKGKYVTFANLMITFLIGGIWHGAGWTFVFWGFLHGAALIFQRIWQKFGIKLNFVVSWLITFTFLNISWVFFRAKEWSDAIRVLKGLFNFDNIGLPSLTGKALLNFLNFKFIENPDKMDKMIILLILLFVVTLFKNSMQLKDEFSPTRKSALCIITLGLISLISLDKVSEFLYFNF